MYYVIILCLINHITERNEAHYRRFQMKMEDCRKCKFHYNDQLDGILCEFSGGFDYRVMTQDKKGIPVVVMCPLDMPLPKKAGMTFGNFRAMADIS